MLEAPAPTTFPRQLLIITLTLILTLAASLLVWWYEPDFGAGVDEASYLLAAKNLALHGSPAYYSPDPLAFVPENMVETQPGIFYPKYPIGYPLLCSIAYKIAGPFGPFMVNPLFTLAALLGMFFMARLFLDDTLALASVFFLAIHPVVLYFGVTALSHACDLALTLWCLYFAFSWYRKPAVYKALLAGFLLGFSISIRYTGSLLILPLALLLILRLRDTRRSTPDVRVSPRTILLHTAAALLAAALGITPLLIYQLTAFGSIFSSGYSLTRESLAFSIPNFLHHFPTALYDLSQLAIGLSFLFPIAIAGLLMLIIKRPREGLFLTLWCIPCMLVYSAYYWLNAVYPLLYVRFFLPIYPGLLIAALLTLAILTRGRRLARAITITLILLTAILNRWLSPNVFDLQGAAYKNRAALHLVKGNLPPDAVILADGYTAYDLLYQTRMTIFYRFYFRDTWIAERLHHDPDSPADFNPLRAQRFADALANRSQDQLDALLRNRLLEDARKDRTLALITDFAAANWAARLAPSFTLVELARDDENALVLYRLQPAGDLK